VDFVTASDRGVDSVANSATDATGQERKAVKR
jgi:hypothetical protein